MPSLDQTIRSYEELAGLYDRKGEGPMRDRFLVLAADRALLAGRGEEAEKMRTRLLQQNPQHLLSPFASMPEAMKSADVQSYIAGLRRSYPPDRAHLLLQEMRAGKVVNPPAENASPSPAAKLSPVKEAIPAAESPAVLKVYRMQDDQAKSAKTPAARTPPTPASAPQKASPPPKPVVTPKPATPALDRAARFAIVPDESDDHDPLVASRWVASILFGILLVTGLAAFFYVFGRPFLPAAWF